MAVAESLSKNPVAERRSPSSREVRGMEDNPVDVCLMKPARQSRLRDALASAWSRRPTAQAESGMDDILPKPLRMETLVATLRKWAPAKDSCALPLA